MTISILPSEPTQSFDLIIAVCGYESRARSIIGANNAIAVRKIAIGYGAMEEVSFSENLAAFLANGYEFKSVNDQDFELFIEDVIRQASADAKVPRILLDISCMTRLRLAQVMEALFAVGAFDVDVYYALAEYSSPSGSEPTYEYLCPVTEYLSGWTGDASKAVAMVSGLGYEQMAAIGIIEHVDPYETWLFFPQSPISEYDISVEAANDVLLQGFPESNLIKYPVLNAQAAFGKLFSLVDSLRRDYRCVIMPLGPKIFALSAIIVGCYFRDVSIWRASAGKHTVARERVASDLVERFRMKFSKED
ncbi:hypothetical protein [Stenotrophomonas sp. C1657]|uniref:hypothetical protein n=1 Tax=Stenotrophomonas sp. C1657 TaxID=3077844 RepID=UPI00293C50B2|nr:hypothetical protein [Stenotrophomonas sp. C1657]MDV3516275.1 hypothetical protein [Stenotrophomonas sp. C1657]